MWSLTVDIYEPKGAGLAYPIVTHIFRGLTQAEAHGYYKAHLSTDQFMRECVTKRRWNQVHCSATSSWEQTI